MIGSLMWVGVMVCRQAAACALTFSGPRAREGKLIFLQETGNHLSARRSLFKLIRGIVRRTIRGLDGARRT